MQTIANYNGQLCVLTNWESDYFKPLEIRLYWPLGVAVNPSTDYLISKEVQYSSNDGFTLADTGQFLYLADGSDTRPVHNETRPVPPPRARRNGRQWEWRQGRWQ